MNALQFQISKRFLSPKQTTALVASIKSKNARFTGRRRAINNLTLPEAQFESRMLYKRFLRAVPELMEKFEITEFSEKRAYEIIREEWDKTGYVSDPRVIDLMLLHGKQELQEMVHFFQQENHIHRRFKVTWKPETQGFMDSFLTTKKM